MYKVENNFFAKNDWKKNQALVIDVDKNQRKYIDEQSREPVLLESKGLSDLSEDQLKIPTLLI